MATTTKTATQVLTHDSLTAALAAFQADMPTVHKGQTARIPGKDGRSGYSYQYADLADVAKIAHPLLAKHGLSFVTQPRHMEGVGFVLCGILRHESGGEDIGMLPITGRSAQDLGSSLTYLRRYLLGCMTGIVTDDDEDGGIANDAGTQRPQAEAPPAYAQEQAQPALAPHQAILNDHLGALAPDDVTKTQAWWRAKGLPPLASLSSEQATEVMNYVLHLTSGGQEAPDPHDAP